jgi:hypothetical protein
MMEHACGTLCHTLEPLKMNEKVSFWAANLLIDLLNSFVEINKLFSSLCVRGILNQMH